MAYHRTTYTIGFMGWYDTFKNTKINYYLPALSLASGPLLYLYIRTTLVAPFKLMRKDWWHFLPVFIFLAYRFVIWAHDSSQPEWDIGYDGEWHRDIHIQYVGVFVTILDFTSQLLYFAFTIQLVSQYSKKIKQYFSNTYNVQLTWLRVFLGVYIFLFLVSFSLVAIDAFIIDLDYIHMWWTHLFASIAIVYLGIRSYFTDLNVLHDLTFDIQDVSLSQHKNQTSHYESEIKKIKTSLSDDKLYTNPDFTLKDLADSVDMTKHEVSEIINLGMGQNFNELVNNYRIEEVKKMLTNNDFDHLSLVAIAFDCGFNSKATFNRVFKRTTGLSPSQYKTSQKNKTT